MSVWRGRESHVRTLTRVPPPAGAADEGPCVFPELAAAAGAVCGVGPLPGLVTEAFGDSLHFEHGRVFRASRVERVPSSEVGWCAGQEALMFRDAPAHLVWMNLRLASTAFSLLTSGRDTAAIFADRAGAATALAERVRLYGATPESVAGMAQSLAAGETRVVERMLSAWLEPPAGAWGTREYYGILACLAPLLAEAPSPVVLGVLCPHVPRKRLPPGECGVPAWPGWPAAARWYVAAADARRDRAWRISVLEWLALPGAYTTCDSPVKLGRKASEILPGWDGATATGCVRLVQRFCVRELDDADLLVPDGAVVRERPVLDGAARGKYSPPARRLEQHRFTAALAERLNRMS